MTMKSEAPPFLSDFLIAFVQGGGPDKCKLQGPPIVTVLQITNYGGCVICPLKTTIAYLWLC